MNKQTEILIVENNQAQAEKLSQILGNNGYVVSVTHNGQTALNKIKGRKPTLIISDIQMPEIDGYNLCRQLKQSNEYSDIPFILLTFLYDPEDIIQALDAGADYYMAKPFRDDYLLSQIATILKNPPPPPIKIERRGALKVFVAGKKYTLNADRQQMLNLLVSSNETILQRNKELFETQKELKQFNEHLEEMVNERTHELHASYFNTIMKLTLASEYRDEETGAHIQRISHYAKILALKLGYDESQAEMVYDAAPMHDVGKISVPDHVLHKGDALNDEEWITMRRHTTYGASLLEGSTSPVLQMARTIALSHHERWDGSGYPQGLNGVAIPWPARIVALADIYDALRSKRPYKPAFKHQKAYDIIFHGDERVQPEHIDPRILESFHEVHLELDRVYDRIKD